MNTTWSRREFLELSGAAVGASLAPTSLRATGVRFVREPKEAPYGTVAVFEDLYGNLWDLVQMVPQQSH